MADNLTITLKGPTNPALKTAGCYCDKNILIVLSGAENIIPTNIKKGVTILGVSGEYEGGGSTQPIVTNTSRTVILGSGTPTLTPSFEVGLYNAAPTVTFNIDNTIIKSTNIVSGITILGIKGTAETITEEQLQALEAL